MRVPDECLGLVSRRQFESHLSAPDVEPWLQKVVRKQGLVPSVKDLAGPGISEMTNCPDPCEHWDEASGRERALSVSGSRRHSLMVRHKRLHQEVC